MRPENVESIIDSLRASLRDVDEAAVYMTVEAGIDYRENHAKGMLEGKPNGTLTLTVKVNGGARDTGDVRHQGRIESSDFTTLERIGKAVRGERE